MRRAMPIGEWVPVGSLIHMRSMQRSVMITFFGFTAVGQNRHCCCVLKAQRTTCSSDCRQREGNRKGLLGRVVEPYGKLQHALVPSIIAADTGGGDFKFGCGPPAEVSRTRGRLMARGAREREGMATIQAQEPGSLGVIRLEPTGIKLGATGDETDLRLVQYTTSR